MQQLQQQQQTGQLSNVSQLHVGGAGLTGTLQAEQVSVCTDDVSIASEFWMPVFAEVAACVMQWYIPCIPFEHWQPSCRSTMSSWHVIVCNVQRNLPTVSKYVQVAALRRELKQLSEQQFVYVAAAHWQEVPHVAWELLQPDEQEHLQQHFSSCSIVAPYVRGEKQLPPHVPGT